MLFPFEIFFEIFSFSESKLPILLLCKNLYYSFLLSMRLDKKIILNFLINRNIKHIEFISHNKDFVIPEIIDLILYCPLIVIKFFIANYEEVKNELLTSNKESIKNIRYGFERRPYINKEIRKFYNFDQQKILDINYWKYEKDDYMSVLKSVINNKRVNIKKYNHLPKHELSILKFMIDRKMHFFDTFKFFYLNENRRLIKAVVKYISYYELQKDIDVIDNNNYFSKYFKCINDTIIKWSIKGGNLTIAYKYPDLLYLHPKFENIIDYEILCRYDEKTIHALLKVCVDRRYKAILKDTYIKSVMDFGNSSYIIFNVIRSLNFDKFSF